MSEPVRPRNKALRVTHTPEGSALRSPCAMAGRRPNLSRLSSGPVPFAADVSWQSQGLRPGLHRGCRVAESVWGQWMKPTRDRLPI